MFSGCDTYLMASGLRRLRTCHSPFVRQRIAQNVNGSASFERSVDDATA